METTHDPHDPERPPPAPNTRRRVRLYPYQWIGLPILLLVPVLAIAGVFGESRQTLAESDAATRYEVDYPTRLRAGQASRIAVSVTNTGGSPADTVVVTIDPGYLDSFAVLHTSPGTVRPWTFVLTGLPYGEPIVVRLEVEGKALWRNSGSVRLHRTGGASHQLDVSTFVFP